MTLKFDVVDILHNHDMNTSPKPSPNPHRKESTNCEELDRGGIVWNEGGLCFSGTRA